MEAASLCIRLLLLELTLLGAHVQNSYTQKSVSDAAVLRISPNRLQFFEYESVTCHCEGTDGSIQLRGIKKTEDFVPACVIKRTPTGSSCTFDKIYHDDSGEYWCETKEGERSSSVHITVSAGSVILDSPALPVNEGSSVTLRCKNRTHSTSSFFYKDGTIMESSPAAHMTINNVSKQNEGLYMCDIDGEKSPGSFLTVRAVAGVEEPPSNDPVSHHVLNLLWVAVIILFLALVLLLVGFHFRKHKVVPCFSSKTPTTATHSEVDNQIVSGNDSADDPNTLTYAVVVTKPRKNKADAAHNTSLHLERNHSRKPQVERDKELVYSTVNIKGTKKMER